MPGDKLTTLEIFNEVWTNLGEEKLTDFSSLTTDVDALKCFDDINALSQEIAAMYPWKVLKPTTKSSITLSSGINYYSPATGLYTFNPESFRYDTTGIVEYKDESRWNEEISDDTLTGTPIKVKYDGTYFYFYRVPTSAEAGKTVTYIGYILPNDLSSSTPTATSWFPAPYDRTVLVKWATYKRLRSRYDAEATSYYSEIWGGMVGRRKVKGSLLEMKRDYADIFNLPVETVNSRIPRGYLYGNADYGRRFI